MGRGAPETVTLKQRSPYDKGDCNKCDYFGAGGKCK